LITCDQAGTAICPPRNDRIIAVLPHNILAKHNEPYISHDFVNPIEVKIINHDVSSVQISFKTSDGFSVGMENSSKFVITLQVFE